METIEQNPYQNELLKQYIEKGDIDSVRKAVNLGIFIFHKNITLAKTIDRYDIFEVLDRAQVQLEKKVNMIIDGYDIYPTSVEGIMYNPAKTIGVIIITCDGCHTNYYHVFFRTANNHIIGCLDSSYVESKEGSGWISDTVYKTAEQTSEEYESEIMKCEGGIVSHETFEVHDEKYVTISYYISNREEMAEHYDNSDPYFAHPTKKQQDKFIKAIKKLNYKQVGNICRENIHMGKKNYLGVYPLDIAVETGDQKMINLMINHSPAINGKERLPTPSLSRGTKEEREVCAAIDTNVYCLEDMDSNLPTAFFEAVANDQIGVVRELLVKDHRLVYIQRKEDGAYASTIAIEKDFMDILDLLFEYGVVMDNDHVFLPDIARVHENYKCYEKLCKMKDKHTCDTFVGPNGKEIRDYGMNYYHNGVMKQDNLFGEYNVVHNIYCWEGEKFVIRQYLYYGDNIEDGYGSAISFSNGKKVVDLVNPKFGLGRKISFDFHEDTFDVEVYSAYPGDTRKTTLEYEKDLDRTIQRAAQKKHNDEDEAKMRADRFDPEKSLWRTVMKYPSRVGELVHNFIYGEDDDNE